MLLDLATLSDATRRLVQDAVHRAELTSALIETEPSSAPSMRARDEIDTAVVEILAAVGLPRGQITGLTVEYFGRGWFGRKAEDCHIMIDTGALARLPEAIRPDSLIRTWIHESLHARQPYASGYGAEWRDRRGFEEGVVEGLTRLVTIQALGLRPHLADYHLYVAAYQLLALVIDLDVEQLWRRLWAVPAGGVSLSLVDILEQMLTDRGSASFSALQRQRIALLAHRLFANQRGSEQPDVEWLVTTWRQVIR